MPTQVAGTPVCPSDDVDPAWRPHLTPDIDHDRVCTAKRGGLPPRMGAPRADAPVRAVMLGLAGPVLFAAAAGPADARLPGSPALDGAPTMMNPPRFDGIDAALDDEGVPNDD